MNRDMCDTPTAIISRKVTPPNGGFSTTMVYLYYKMFNIHHSGWESSKCTLTVGEDPNRCNLPQNTLHSLRLGGVVGETNLGGALQNTGGKSACVTHHINVGVSDPWQYTQTYTDTREYRNTNTHAHPHSALIQTNSQAGRKTGIGLQ